MIWPLALALAVVVGLGLLGAAYDLLGTCPVCHSPASDPDPLCPRCGRGAS